MTRLTGMLHPALCIALLLLAATTQARTAVTAAPYSAVATFPRLTAPATVVSLEEADLSAQIAARVLSIGADVGAEVTSGDLLVSLECRDYELAQDMAKAQLDGANASLQLAQNRQVRARKLLEQNLTSVEDMDSAAANLAAAQAEVARSRAALARTELDRSRCQVTAPFDGTVKQRHVSPGQLAAVGTPLLRLVNHRHLEISATISQQHLDSFDRDTRFSFMGLTSYAVTFQRAVRALDEKSRTLEIRLAFDDAMALPGAAGKLAWHSRRPHIGSRHLVSRDGETGYFTVQDGVARFVPLGAFIPERDFPLDADPDTLILIDKLQSLSDGDPIAVSIVDHPES